MACISPSRCAITAGAVAASSSCNWSQSSHHQLAMPSSSFSGDSVSPFLHAGICSPLRIGTTHLVAPRRRVSNPGVVESVLADLAEENVVCH